MPNGKAFGIVCRSRYEMLTGLSQGIEFACSTAQAFDGGNCMFRVEDRGHIVPATTGPPKNP